jgi:hypothetical protein
MRDLSKKRFDVKVTYESVSVEYMHRYHIKCIDLNCTTTIYHSTSVIDKDCFISDEEARERIRNYFKIYYGIDLPL